MRDSHTATQPSGKGMYTAVATLNWKLEELFYIIFNVSFARSGSHTKSMPKTKFSRLPLAIRGKITCKGLYQVSGRSTSHVLH